MKTMWALAAIASAALAEPVIDNTATRVQTTLDPGMECVGTLRPKSVGEIKTSRWTLGCETIDREYSDYHAWKEYLPPLGIGRIRLQAGWARCEKDPGTYDFAWLDSIIFDAQKRGISVWLEPSYGNPAHPGGGTRTLSGGWPTSTNGLAAWDKWVGTMAKRYKGTVRDWCIWNEPNNDPKLIGDGTGFFDFTIRTAEVIKREQPEARIGALAFSWPDEKLITAFVKTLEERGKAGLFTWIVYHHYTANPDEPYRAVEAAQKIVREHAPALRLWQGESGVESEWCKSGALSRKPWTELSQAKWDARRYLADLGHDVDTEVFTAADLDYRTTWFHNGLVRYGLLKTAGQAENFRVLKVKMSYYAVQNIVSVFNDAVLPAPDLAIRGTGLDTLTAYGFRDTASKTPLVVFWDKAGAMPSNDNATKPATLSFSAKPFANPVWVDTLTGNAYAIPPASVSSEGGTVTFKDIPVYDAPAFITDASALTLDKSEEVQIREAQKKKE